MPEGETCSIGIAEWDGLEEPSSLLGRADAALYEAKHRGRDLSVIV
jgi:PleD family two-component response regulator